MSNGEPFTYNLIVFGTQSRFQPARIDPLLDSERVFSWMSEMESQLKNAAAREGWRLDDAEWIEREKARQIAALKERFPEAFQEVQR